MDGGADAPTANGRANTGPEEMVSTNANEKDAPKVLPDVRGWSARRKHEKDLLGAPLRLLIAPAIFYKACFVLFPYIYAEVAP